MIFQLRLVKMVKNIRLSKVKRANMCTGVVMHKVLDIQLEYLSRNPEGLSGTQLLCRVNGAFFITVLGLHGCSVPTTCKTPDDVLNFFKNLNASDVQIEEGYFLGRPSTE